jgi:hypothetical protein
LSTAAQLTQLATRDVAGVDAPMDAFIDIYEAWIARATGS